MKGDCRQRSSDGDPPTAVRRLESSHRGNPTVRPDLSAIPFIRIDGVRSPDRPGTKLLPESVDRRVKFVGRRSRGKQISLLRSIAAVGA